MKQEAEAYVKQQKNGYLQDMPVRKEENRMDIEITKNENIKERLAAYAEKTAK